MIILKRIFGFSWLLYAAVVFMLVVAFLTPLYAVILLVGGKKYSMKLVWWNYHIFSPLFLTMYGIKLKVYGKEKIDASKTYVFVANHTSQIDIITSATATPQPARFLAKAEIKYIPFFGFMVKMLAIMVNRTNKESKEKSYRYMAAALQKGESLFIYPEGTRNRGNELLKEFKDGAFKVAIMAQVPIAVQTIVGARELNPVEGFQLYPGNVNVYWGNPIETTGMTLNDLPALKDKVRNEMLSHLK